MALELIGPLGCGWVKPDVPCEIYADSFLRRHPARCKGMVHVMIFQVPNVPFPSKVRKSKRTVIRSKRGKRFYAKRNKRVQFKDIQHIGRCAKRDLLKKHTKSDR